MHRRIAPLLAAVLGAGLLTAAAPAAPAERAAAPKTVVGVAAGDKRFTTLVALVKQAGLAKTLSGKGPFTVFAPDERRVREAEGGRAGDVRRRSPPTRRC